MKPARQKKTGKWLNLPTFRLLTRTPMYGVRVMRRTRPRIVTSA